MFIKWKNYTDRESYSDDDALSDDIIYEVDELLEQKFN
jgi:hypothetical protein